MDLILYRTENDTWNDPWGRSQPVQRVVGWVRVHRAGSFPVSDGYGGTYPAWVAVTRSGRTFVKRVPTDFGGSASWVAMDDRTRWTDRPTVPLLDMQGKPVRPADLLRERLRERTAEEVPCSD